MRSFVERHTGHDRLLTLGLFVLRVRAAMCPKDCRASFITWLRDGDHGDAVLASAAKDMHHGVAMQCVFFG